MAKKVRKDDFFNSYDSSSSRDWMSSNSEDEAPKFIEREAIEIVEFAKLMGMIYGDDQALVGRIQDILLREKIEWEANKNL